MNITLYRAIPASKFDAQKVYKRYPTLRAPSNIPYVVDNLLEWLRPEDMPNRRFCAYANLTAEQALKNASDIPSQGDVLKAYKLKFSGGDIKIANLPQDARYHPSIKALQKLVVEELNSLIQSGDLASKSAVAPLFFPCLTKDQMNELRQSSELVAKVLDKAKEKSTFWQDAVFVPGQTQLADGELFFELVSAADSYTLSE